MNTEEKDLAYFQQQVAKDNGYKNINDFPNLHVLFIAYNEAANLYAAYRFEQGKQAGEAKGYNQGYNDYAKKSADHVRGAIIKGWNEAIQWAAEQMEEYYKSGLTNTADRVRQSILNGLKQEEE